MTRGGRLRKKRNLPILLASLLLFAAGAGIFLYPVVSNLLAEYRHENVINTYQARVEESDAQDLEAAWEAARVYNDNLTGDPVHDPFVLGSGYVLPDNYLEVLNLGGDGVMGYLEIPKIDSSLPIYHGTSEEVLREGIGHLEMSTLPIGGENRHAVLSAHRGLPSAELFTRLDEMEIGDQFYIHVLNEVLAYEVSAINVIEPEDLALLKTEEGQDLVTLVTCTPYAVNTHRLLVTGHRVPYVAPEGEGDSTQILNAAWRLIYGGGIALGILLLILIVVLLKKRRKKQEAAEEKEAQDQA